MREKWKVRKGWIKLHVLSDVHTDRILAYAVTDERSGDPRHLQVLADGAYDARYNWNGMRGRGIEFVPNICRKDLHDMV